MIFSESSSAARRPTSGLAPAPRPGGEAHAELQLDRRLAELERLHVGIGGDELHALHAGLDHAVDGVAAAAAHADDLDARAARGFVVKLNAHLSGLVYSCCSMAGLRGRG